MVSIDSTNDENACVALHVKTADKGYRHNDQNITHQRKNMRQISSTLC